MHRLAHNGLGCGRVEVTNEMEGDNNAKFNFHSNHNIIQRFNGMTPHLNLSIRFHLNGNLKGNFQFLGCSGYDYHYCVRWQIGARGKMNNCHEHINAEEPNPFELYTMQKLKENGNITASE